MCRNTIAMFVRGETCDNETKKQTNAYEESFQKKTCRR
jgi:hypothetical protein